MACFALFWASTSSLLKPGSPVMLPAQIRASHSSHENLHRNAEMPSLAKKAAMRWESLLRALSMLNSARRCRWQRFRVVQRCYVFFCSSMDCRVHLEHVLQGLVYKSKESGMAKEAEIEELPNKSKLRWRHRLALRGSKLSNSGTVLSE
jgi:hypothetical protein